MKTITNLTGQPIQLTAPEYGIEEYTEDVVNEETGETESRDFIRNVLVSDGVLDAHASVEMEDEEVTEEIEAIPNLLIEEVEEE